jgi:hypothetical protein
VNNNKQIGLASHMYSTDNRDKMAYPNWNPPWQQGWLYTPVGNQPPNLMAAPYNMYPQQAYEGGLLWTYVGKNMGVYRCPLDKTNTPTFLARANKMSTYVWNGAVCGYGGVANGGTYSEPQFRQDAFLEWEPDDQNAIPGYGYNDGSSYPDPAVDGGLGKRHGKIGGVVLAFDGHVEFIKYDVWKAESQSPYPNRMYCNPGSANGR